MGREDFHSAPSDVGGCEIKGAGGSLKYFQKNEDFCQNGVFGPYMYGRGTRFFKNLFGRWAGAGKKSRPPGLGKP
jgi:hypothetical protein